MKIKDYCMVLYAVFSTLYYSNPSFSANGKPRNCFQFRGISLLFNYYCTEFVQYGKTSSRVFPLVFPLQVQNALYEALHARRACLLHLIRNMAVYVQRKGGRRMAEIALNCLYIVARANGCDRVTMP